MLTRYQTIVKGVLVTLFMGLRWAGAQEKINFESGPDSATLFPSHLINTGNSERDFAISPDGKELFFTLQAPKGIFQTLLYSRKLSNDRWTNPVIAPFSGNYSDLEPAFSTDGRKLFFSSNRPVEGNSVKDFDIWVVEKSNGAWGLPKNVGSPINTPKDEFYPSITASGNLYFTAAYEHGIGREDIYLAKYDKGTYQSPVVLDTSINSAHYEFNAFVGKNEDYIIFTSYGRTDDKGGGDLYISKKNEDGQWQSAVHLEFLNSDKLDYCPFVSFDQKIFFFTSERSVLKDKYEGRAVTLNQFKEILSSPLNGGGNIYWVKFEKLLKLIR